MPCAENPGHKQGEPDAKLLNVYLPRMIQQNMFAVGSCIPGPALVAVEIACPVSREWHKVEGKG